MMNINIINAIIACIFLLPIISGMISPFTRDVFHKSFLKLFDNVELFFGIVVSVFLTKKIFFENNEGIFKDIYELIPDAIKNMLHGQDIMVYIFSVPVILLVFLAIFRVITNFIYEKIIFPAADASYRSMESFGSTFKRLVAGVWKIPKAAYLVFLFSILLNFFSYYISTPELNKAINESSAYQFLYKNAVYPVLNSNIAKEIPVLVNDSFRKSAEIITPNDSSTNGTNSADQLLKQLKKNIHVIEYFNGVTLDEAVKSSPEINEMALKIVGSETDEYKKAFLLYKWVSRNVKYDYDKAAKISKDPRGISSGAIVAFNTRSGICFDHSSLYIAMCKAVGIKARLITGLGYSGLSWGDHAWNQIYYQKENRWVNVDCTFGIAANYFDKSDFSVDHKLAEVQGEW